AWLELGKIDEIGQNCRPVFGNAAFRNQALANQARDSYVFVNTRESQGSFLPGKPAMHALDGRYAGEMQQRRKQFHVMLAVNDVRNNCQIRELIGNRYHRLAKLASDFPKDRAIADRVMP